MTQDEFFSAYQALERRMRALAEADGDVFLPNPAPSTQVDHVLICMEPSLGRWAQTKDEAVARVEDGFLNFLSSLEDFILHFAARRYLCRPDEDYFVTDFSKGAMLVQDAHVDRLARYNRWFPLLREELDLVARPGATFITVGRPVSEQLKRRGYPSEFTRIIHYSGQAAPARNACVAGHEPGFEIFRYEVTRDDILEDAEQVLRRAGLAPHIREGTLKNLRRWELTESRLKLLYCYKLTFEQLRTARQAGES